MTFTQQDHDRVWYVVYLTRDGQPHEAAFPNRTLAEVFLADIPHGAPDIARAMLRPSGTGYN